MEPITLLLIVLVGLLPCLWFLLNYNRMARLKQQIRESWSDIDVELKRRYELIPNLVETVRGYALHERTTLERIIELRNRAKANVGSAASQAADESALLIEMKKLFAVAEGYPPLKADAGFQALQKQLATTENRIAAARRFFNGNVREMNQLCQTIPTNLIAALFRFDGGGYFELDSDLERIVPRVEP